MKIVFTVCDFGAAIHVGADMERTSHIVEIEDTCVPLAVKEAIEYTNSTVAVSILNESPK